MVYLNKLRNYSKKLTGFGRSNAAPSVKSFTKVRDNGLFGQWSITRCTGFEEVLSSQLKGLEFQLLPNGILSNIENGKAYFGQWRLAGNKKYLELRFSGNGINENLSGRWTIRFSMGDKLELIQKEAKKISQVYMSRILD